MWFAMGMDDIAAATFKSIALFAGFALLVVSVGAVIMFGAAGALPKVRARGRRHVVAVEMCWFTIASAALLTAMALLGVEGR